MKTSRAIFVFTVINLICSIIFICFLPDSVIFGLTGNMNASEYVGKWYDLIIPIVQVICTLIIYLVDVFNPKEHKYRYLTSWVAISFTTYILWVLMFLQYENFTLGTKLVWPWTIIILFPIALFLLADGYYTTNKDPKDFSLFGMKWVRSNLIVWKKTHFVAGISLNVFAFITIILAVLNEIFWHTYWIYLIVIIVWVVVHYLYTLICANNYAKRFGTK